MEKEQVMQFKKLFENERNRILKTRAVVTETLTIHKDDMLDQADLTSTEMEQGMQIKLKNREATFLKKLNEALQRIKIGSFGECLDCGDEIELRRLQARPTTEFCVTCKEEQERRERGFAGSKATHGTRLHVNIA